MCTAKRCIRINSNNKEIVYYRISMIDRKKSKSNDSLKKKKREKTIIITYHCDTKKKIIKIVTYHTYNHTNHYYTCVCFMI